jgi:hypothetical protein
VIYTLSEAKNEERGRERERERMKESEGECRRVTELVMTYIVH